MQQHVKRALLLLCVMIIGFLIVRSIMVPESFGKYGWYRGDSVNDNMNFKVEYSNSNKCADCHENIYSMTRMSFVVYVISKGQRDLANFRRLIQNLDMVKI